MGRRSKHRREMTANLVKALKERGKLGEVLEVDPKNRASRNIQALIADVANEIAKEEKMPIVNPSQTKQILADVKKDQKTIQSIERLIYVEVRASRQLAIAFGTHMYATGWHEAITYETPRNELIRRCHDQTQ